MAKKPSKTTRPASPYEEVANCPDTPSLLSAELTYTKTQIAFEARKMREAAANWENAWDAHIRAMQKRIEAIKEMQGGEGQA